MQLEKAIDATRAGADAKGSDAATAGTLRFRKPRKSDGAAVWSLIRSIGALDDNSMYCNLLQCSHFAATCAIAELDGELVGWISGYLPPDQPDTLFVWQVAVHPDARGRGVAKRLIHELLRRPECRRVRHIHSTITPDNAASWALFRAIADDLDAPIADDPHFERDAHFDGQHDTEHLVEIGPFDRVGLRRVA
ncbi:MAG: diaminobutyrate acetyltransferase [Kiloniellaceae bacterium]